MKKVFVFALAMLMCMTLAACWGNSDTATITTTSQTVSVPQETTKADAPAVKEEDIARFVGVWTDGNITLTILEDGSCNQFTKEGYVKGEAKTNISIDYRWEVDQNGGLMTIDDTEGGYNTWAYVVEDGAEKLRLDVGSVITLTKETENKK